MNKYSEIIINIRIERFSIAIKFSKKTVNIMKKKIERIYFKFL